MFSQVKLVELLPLKQQLHVHILIAGPWSLQFLHSVKDIKFHVYRLYMKHMSGKAVHV